MEASENDYVYILKFDRVYITFLDVYLLLYEYAIE